MDYDDIICSLSVHIFSVDSSGANKSKNQNLCMKTIKKIYPLCHLPNKSNSNMGDY
jgi:hypothetical protein